MRGKITFVLVLTLVVGMLSFAGCSSDNSIIGTWSFTEAGAMFKTITFDEGGGGTAVTLGDDEMIIKWEFKGEDTLSIA